jgi:hypothetical protein
MRPSRLETIDNQSFRQLGLEEQSNAIGGGFTYHRTIGLTNSGVPLGDIIEDTVIADVTPDEPPPA